MRLRSIQMGRWRFLSAVGKTDYWQVANSWNSIYVFGASVWWSARERCSSLSSWPSSTRVLFPRKRVAEKVFSMACWMVYLMIMFFLMQTTQTARQWLCSKVFEINRWMDGWKFFGVPWPRSRNWIDLLKGEAFQRSRTEHSGYYG